VKKTKNLNEDTRSYLIYNKNKPGAYS